MKRVFLGGIFAGIAMFLWEGLAHEVLPLGEAGIKGLNSDAVLSSIRDNVKETGFYIFPWIQPSPAATKEQAMQQSMEKAKAGPAGLMVVAPAGREYNMGKLLGIQCIFDVIVMMLAAGLVSWTGVLKEFGGRMLFVTLLGVLPTLSVELPYWNWYNFPSTFVAAQAVVHLVGYLVGGLVIAAIVKPVR